MLPLHMACKYHNNYDVINFIVKKTGTTHKKPVKQQFWDPILDDDEDDKEELIMERNKG